MAWDPIRQRIVLFGGVSATGQRLSDTWTWDGSTWAQLDTVGTPGPRSNAAMAYDPDRNGMVLFGGQTSATAVAPNDTWVLGASGWTKVLNSGQAGAPLFRTNAMLAYLGNPSSGHDGQLVLFGGAACSAAGCSNPNAVNDTWVLLSGGSWVKQTPTQSPTAVSAASFVYDSQLDADVLFGGLTAGSNASNDTWAWTGTSWLRAQDGIGAPDARYSAQVAVGSSGSLSVMGGVIPARATTAPLDRWSYDAKKPVLGVSLSEPTDDTNVYLAGQVVAVTIAAQNTGLDDLTSADATTISANLNNGTQAVLSAVGSTVKWAVDPNDPVPACRALPAGSTVAGLVAGLTPTVTRAAISAGCTATASFLAVVVGSPLGCAEQAITAHAGNAYGTSGDVSTQVPICGNGLGREDWWSYNSTDLGAGGTANVNVANGNLVVSQDDSTTIQSHGDLAFSLSRSYNSQDVISGNTGQSSVLGTGWQFNIGETGLAANGVSIGSLIVPTLNSVLDPLSVTYIDRDGTRFVFRPKTPSLDNASGSLLAGASLLTKTALTKLVSLPKILGQDLPSILNSLNNGNTPLLCVDTTYTPPAGADMHLFRYLAFGSSDGASSCSSADASAGVTVGYSIVRPDRIRYDFNLLGKLSDTIDGAGNTLFYDYDAANRPSHIYAGTCVPTGQAGAAGTMTGPACRQYAFRYGTPDPSGSRIDVTDPAGRVTTYIVVPEDLATGAPPLLTQVWNPDNPYAATGTPSIKYTYSATNAPCPGSEPTAATIGQLCAATDPLGARTTIAYSKGPLGPDRVLSVTDRRANSASNDGGPSRGKQVRYRYYDGYTTADSATPNTFGANGSGCTNNPACERTRYASINAVGSVGEVDQGNAADAYVTQQAFFWDSDEGAEPCRQPDRVVDFDLCQTLTRAKPSTAPFEIDHPGTATINGVTASDHATRYSYGDLGQVLITDSIIDPSQPWTADNSAITTTGAHDQYVEAGDTVRAFDDTPRGSGTVESTSIATTTPYGDAISADRPLAFYRFAEPNGSATLTDSSGRGSAAAYGANVPRGLPGPITGDPAIGNSGSYAAASSAFLNGFASGTGNDAAFSIEAWQQAPRPDTYLVACSPCSSTGLKVGRYNGAPSVYLDAGSGGGIITVVASSGITDGLWHQVDYTYDGSGRASGVAIYVDGEPVATTTLADDHLTKPYRTSSDSLQYAASIDGAYNDGTNLADLSIYSGALSAHRVASHHRTVSSLARADARTLYAVSDQTATLTPRGNDPSNASRWGDFLTTYVRDVPPLAQDAEMSAATPNRKLTDTVCGATTTNTGLVCATVSPASAGVDRGDCPASSVGVVANPPGTAPHTCSTATYNTYGEMITKRSPKAHASGSAQQTKFAYYVDTGTCSGAAARNCDLSANRSAGGWLKGVTDVNDNLVVYAYDAAGNTARTWDRNATVGHSLTDNWTDASNPPSMQYSETDMANPVTSASLSAGTNDVEIVRGDGTVWGSGNNSQNELGDNAADGGSTAALTPVQANGVHGVVQVVQNGLGGASSSYTTTARTTSGAVYTWGSNKPVTRIGNLPPVISLAAGGSHVLALDITGAVYAWGANATGQLGNGNTGSTVSTPIKVLSGVSTIAAGANSSYAAKTDGSVWAWGDNTYGQLATGDTSSRSAPTKSAGLANVIGLYSGTTTAYAITADGSVWAWGDNTAGALGTGSTAAATSTPSKITAFGAGTAAGTVRQIAGAAFGAAALMSDGHVRAWGLNTSGQLGAGTASSSTPMLVPGVSGQVALTGGWSTYLASDTAGALTIWGNTAAGQKGDGTTPATSPPTAVAAAQTITPYAAPWRYARGSRDAIGNLKTMVANPDGDVTQMTPARGTAVVTAAYDSTLVYSSNNQPLSGVAPMERDGRDNTGALTGNAAPMTAAYDAFGNALATTNPRGNTTVTNYDSADRKLSVATTRATPADAGNSGCGSTATAGPNSFSAAQTGHVMCTMSTTYDGNNKSVTTTDALQQTTRTTYDGLGRATAVATPRNDGSYTNLTTYTNYDHDGNKVDSCPPRQTAAPQRATTGCSSTGVYSTHATYDPAGRATASIRYRAPQDAGPAEQLVTSYGYDADGNQVSTTDPAGRNTTTTFDLLDRKTAQTTPRSDTERHTTRWRYDPSGNVTAVLAPGAAPVGSGADGPLTVDGSTNPKTNPFHIPDNAQYTTVTLRNGGWIAGQSGGLVFAATGAVTVCSTCGITEAGDGRAGGAGGAGALTTTSNGVAGDNAQSGGKAGIGSAAYAGGGGGGGHKTPGTAGKDAATAGGAGGGQSGSSDFSDIAMNYLDASGGGGGGGGHSALYDTPAGKGGNGGGFIHITAGTVSIDGTVDASGMPGANSGSSAGGGGGGAGGSIWLAASDVTVAAASSLRVDGGTGGTSGSVGTTNGYGGAGSPGYIHVDTDGTLPSGADADGHLANITAYSYDADNRALDTLTGAQTTDATATTAAGVPDGNGLTNTRTRNVYDPDGHVVATLPPQAFAGAGSPTTLTVNPDTAARSDFDFDGRQTTSYDPRYDTASAGDTGAGDDGGTGKNLQTSQCPPGAAASLAPGLTGYSATIGVCATTVSFDANGNPIKLALPTSNGHDNRFLARSYTDDDLVLTETTPDPSQTTGTARNPQHIYRYDGDQRLTQDTDANGNQKATRYTADGLTAETDRQCYNVGGTSTGSCAWSGGTTVTHRKLMSYDADGHLTKTMQPRAQDPNQSSATGLTAADFTTTTTWTSDGLKQSIQAPGLAHGDFDTTIYSFDKVGNQIAVGMPSANASTADASNPGRLKTEYQFTDDNLIKASSTPVSATSYRNVVYSYNPAGQKVSTSICTVASRNTCPDLKPNADGTTPDSQGQGITRYSYAPNGLNIMQIAKAYTATPTTIRTSYDQAGRVRSITDSTQHITITAGYYLDGLPRTVDDGTNLNTYAYDGASHLTNRTDKTAATGITGGATKRTSYAYNDAGLLARMVSDVHAGDATTLAYDPGGRMTTWTDTGGGTGQTRTYSYQPDDTLAAVNTRASGDTTDRLDYAYAYDNDGNITSQVASGSANSNYTNRYAYNPAANITSYNHTRSGNDPTATSSTTYSWDHNANRLTANTTSGSTTINQSWQYRTDNSISSQTSAATGAATVTRNYTYNQAGLLTTITPAGGQTACTTNTYDDLDRIKIVVTGNDPTNCGTSTSSTVTYTYDGLDRQRTAVNGSNPATTTIYDGLSKTTTGQSNADAGDNTKPTNLYELTPDGRHVAVWQASSTGSAASLIDDDNNGNTSLLINSSKSGSAATGCTVNYDPFGTPGTATTPPQKGNGVCNGGSDASTTGNTTWYRDQRRDGTTGNYQLGSRTYNPVSSSFTTPDSYRVATPSTDLAVGTDPLTANTYAYVNGNPLNVDDPDGHHPCATDGPCLSLSGTHTAADKCPYTGKNCDKLRKVDLGKGILPGIKGSSKKDIDALMGAWYFGSLTASENYWDPTSSAYGYACYGAAGCQQALYILRTTQQSPADIARARHAAAYYCIEHKKKCDWDAGFSSVVFGDIHAVPNLIALNLLGGRAASESEAGGATGLRALNLSRQAFGLQRLTEDAAANGGVGPVVAADTAGADATVGDRVAASCGGGSFRPDTKVVMADGSTEPLDQVKVGDKVEATDTKTGKSSARTVTIVWVNHDTDLMDVTVRAGGTTSVIHATQKHLFWVPAQHAWVEADHLVAGEMLRTDNGATATVAGTVVVSGAADMWDLTVSNDHDFYVVATTANVLVHNNCYGSTPGGRPFTRHYGVETGPERNIPGSVIDEAIDNYPGKAIDGGKTVHYDPNNDVTVITGDGDSIVSVRRGPPRPGQR